MKQDFAKSAIRKVERFCNNCSVRTTCYVVSRSYVKAMFTLNEELKSYHPNKYTAKINGVTMQLPDWSI